MSVYILTLALSAARSGVAAPQQSSPTEQLASVKGVVTNSVTGDRLRKAFVRLTGRDSHPATTDDQGRFAFENLPPGTYRMEGEHAGYLTSLLNDASGAAVELRVSSGETMDVNFKLTPQAAIGGRVVDADGDAWVHADIGLYHSVFKQGKRRLEPLQSADSLGDKGDFRMGNLPPGTYYIRAVPAVEWERDNRLPTEERLQPTWYPNSFEIEGSTPLILSPGQELAGIEIRLRKGATHRIRGTVSGLDNVPNPSDQSVRRIWATLTSGPGGNAYSAYLSRAGSFEIQGLAPGEYDVTLLQGRFPISLGNVKVQVDDRDVEGVSIELARMGPLKGTLRFEENEGRVSGWYVRFENLDSKVGNQFALTRADGSFDFPVAPAGRYRVFLPGALQYYLKRIRHEGKESSGGIVSLSEGENSVELVLSAKGARVAANLKEGDGKVLASAGRVVLIPDAESAEEREYGTRSAVQDQNGGFTVGNIAPGTYRLFAFENVPNGAWVDAEFWKEIRSKGTELRISEGESKTADAPLVLKSEIASLLSRLGME